MKKVAMVVAMVVLFATMAMAQSQDTQNCYQPEPSNCNGVVTLPGLWKIANSKLCGEAILFSGSSVMINDEVVMLNKVRKLTKVESCN